MEDFGKIRNYRDLVLWQKAMDLAELVYLKTQDWPRTEAYGLTQQIRRAVISIPCNVAEGQGRTGTKEFLHHLSIARGSLFEVETQVQLAFRIGYLTTDSTDVILSACGEISRIISGLARSLTDRSNH